MDGNDVSADSAIAELIDMGFEFPIVLEAIEAVGPCLDDAVEFILKGSRENSKGHRSVANGRSLNSNDCSTSEACVLGKRSMSSRSQGRMKQCSIVELVNSSGRVKKSRSDNASIASTSGSENSNSRQMEERKASIQMNHKLVPVSESCQYEVHACNSHAKSEVSSEENGLSLYSSDDQKPELGWEEKVSVLLQKHFGFSSLKGFQKEALEAWLERRDCLVLAATGSGTCF